MSARSAYARKKVTETTRARAKSHASSDGASIHDTPRDRHYERDITGRKPPDHRDHTSHSGSSSDGRRERLNPNDSAYTYAPRPSGKTQDVSAIEKSGLRSALDKKTDGVRKGLAKAFAFTKKERSGDDTHTPVDFRPESAATVRPSQSVGARSQDHYDNYESVKAPGRHRGAFQEREVRWDEAGNIHSRAAAEALPPVKRWSGAGRPVQRWNKLRKDPELWDPNGDVLVFLGKRDQSSHLNPSFRLSSHIIEATESRYLITLLRDGALEDDLHMPPSPASPTFQQHGLYGQQRLAPGGFGRGGQPTPPGSEDSSLWNADGQVSYEMYMPSPPDMSPVDQLRHNITTRNLFALLCHASLVGFSLHQALTDLHSRLDECMPPTADSLGALLNYVSGRALDDVRNDPETAVSILAWSESIEVRWEDGWREAFLHGAGMYARLESSADFEHVTPLTRALLERACLETQLRVQAAEERLAAFEFGDMWPPALAAVASANGPVVAAPAKAAMDRLQQFFMQYYAQEFGTWPPPVSHKPIIGTSHEAEDDVWLTRTVAQLLQRDFAALYDYLVNRDIVWDESETRSSRKWMMVSASGNRGFDADTPDLPMTDMLVEFDNRHRFPHIPHPYPIVPESIPSLAVANAPSKELSSGSGIFGSKSTNKTTAASASTHNGNRTTAATERRIQLAYTEASNIYALGSAFTHSSLVDAFRKFEKADRVGDVDPAVARRGRWVLIYGVLQTLASVSVDAPGVRYKDGVGYHLSPRLRGVRVPPWRTVGKGGGGGVDPQEAAHELSHCWTVPATWHVMQDGSQSEAGSELDEGSGGGASPVVGYAPSNAGSNNGSGSRQSGQFSYPNHHHQHQQHQHLSGFLTPPVPRRSAAAARNNTSTTTTTNNNNNRLAVHIGGGGGSSIRSITTTTTAPSSVDSVSGVASIMSASNNGVISSYTSTGSSRAPSLAPSTAAISLRSWDGKEGGGARAPSRAAAPITALPPLMTGEPRRRLPARPDGRLDAVGVATVRRQQHQHHQQQHHETEEDELDLDVDESWATAATSAVPARVYTAGAVSAVSAAAPSSLSNVAGARGVKTRHVHRGRRAPESRRGLSELDDLLDEVDVDVDVVEGEVFVMSQATYGQRERGVVRGDDGGVGGDGGWAARGGAPSGSEAKGDADADADADGVGPVIRDFDELGVMD